ncbi:MAG: hypothetical protein LBT82_03975 [Oscillospiraceae bacterium]|nr:hypothetical protein [Oscillospiraceae bacterium]
MLNLLRSDFYKTSRMKVFYVFLFSTFLFASSFSFFIIRNALKNSYLDDKVSVSQLLLNNLGCTMLFSTIFTALFMGNDFKFNIVGSVISRGISRSNYYFSKLIVSVLLYISLFILDKLCVLAVGSGYKISFGDFNKFFFLWIFCEITCGLSSVCFANMLVSFFGSRSLIFIMLLNFGSLVVIPIINGLLHAVLKINVELENFWMGSANMFHPEYKQSLKESTSARDIVKNIIWCVVFTAIGILSFQKRDIKNK